MTNHEPSNAELKELHAEVKTLLQQHMAQAEARDRAQSEKTTEIMIALRTQGTQLIDINQRLNKVEAVLPKAASDALRALDSQAELEGSLLREVGALAHNDKKQNVEMSAIKEETKKQSVTLGKLEAETQAQSGTLAKITESVAEIQTWKKAALLLVAMAPGAWVVIEKLIAVLERVK